MSIFNELILSKIVEISKQTEKDFDDELKGALECLHKFEEEFIRGRSNARNKAQNEKTLMTTTLQSINEDEDESNKTPETNVTKAKETATATDNEAEKEKRRVTKKRSKEEVEGMSSPEVDKRQKRNASVKAQGIISQQSGRQILKEFDDNDVTYVSTTNVVNVNLTQKLRREESSEGAKSRGRRRKDDDKENARPFPLVQVKLEKMSMPPEPMDMESLPANIVLKKEPNKDDIAMPPPTAPVPKPRKAVQKEKSAESSEDESGTGKKRSTRGRKATETMPPPTDPIPSARSTRASSRASSRATKQVESTPDVPPEETRPKRTRGRKQEPASSHASSCETTPDAPPEETRPKRTRGRKKASETAPADSEKDKPQDNGIGSPADKPRPKRTRRAQKAAEKEVESQSSQEEISQTTKTPQIPLKTERISQPESNSPVLQRVLKAPKNYKKNDEKKTKSKKDKQNTEEVNRNTESSEEVVEKNSEVDATKVVLNETRVIENGGDMDKTMVLPNGVYNHAPVTPQSVTAANATVVLDVCTRDTMVLDTHAPLNATVVLDKGTDPKATNITDDNSLITNDSDNEVHTPPKPVPKPQPTSAVKEKVQQFEELAARTTRTKTRAMAKLEEPENHTPPEKIINPILSAETLTKMNNMIFNGKPPQISSSATKPRAIPPPKPLAASTSKLSSISRHREAAEEAKREKEDARKKKEAMLEAKRELQKKKREEKMAAAAAAREAAEKERKLAMEQAARDRMEKQAHADQGKLERLKEVERKKQELARKVAETEERRKAEEQARQLRLAEEQRKAELARRKQLEEAEQMKKEAALIAKEQKEMEKKQKEYYEKQRLNKMHTPHKALGTPGYHTMEPVYMEDGFEHLNSDEESESPKWPVPAWSTNKMRRLAFVHQSEVDTTHIDALFSVRVRDVDLREIFPAIDRARLKRTSSAVWRTPPTLSRLPALRE